MPSRPLAEAGKATASGKTAQALSQRRRLFFMDGFQPGTDGPHRLLAQRAFERRHIDATVAHRTLADARQEDFVTLVAERQIAQIRSNAAGNGTQAMATSAVLVVGGIANADRRLVLAVRIGSQEIGAEILQAGGIDGLRHDIAMGKNLRRAETDGEGGDESAEGAGCVFHFVSLISYELLPMWAGFCKPCARRQGKHRKDLFHGL